MPDASADLSARLDSIEQLLRQLVEQRTTRDVLTVPQIAKRWGVGQKKVAAAIASGKLQAFDLATPGAKRPRWRVRLADLEAYELSRTAKPGGEARRPVRRRRSTATKYF